MGSVGNKISSFLFLWFIKNNLFDQTELLLMLQPVSSEWLLKGSSK